MDSRETDQDDLELALSVSPPMVTSVRRFVEAVVQRLGADAELSGRISLTAHELVENVAKYGTNNRAVLRMRWSPKQGNGPSLTLTVTNTASASHVDRLRRMFEDMDAGGDPVAHYFTLMQREVAEGESGLGLARIRAEADMGLLLTVHHNDVSIVATCPQPSPTRPLPVRN